MSQPNQLPNPLVRQLNTLTTTTIAAVITAVTDPISTNSHKQLMATLAGLVFGCSFIFSPYSRLGQSPQGFHQLTFLLYRQPFHSNNLVS
jgi:hypothetical protein